MSVQKQMNPHFEVKVHVTYVESESRPDQNQYFFAYKVNITNKSTAPAQLMSRHWIITDSIGQVEEVRGAGVVGVQPKIQPGQSFEYESACPLVTASGQMRGTYQMVSDMGESFEVEIPEFYLIAPHALH
ncbi:MAG: Co2+/Mg2+ efflux protein ApaG [Bdellovibrionaceae bacterium]|nr:Co2+/Mg2+ efflux protein ApaG [Pseudobdellovibrionaceae bacterium]